MDWFLQHSLARWAVFLSLAWLALCLRRWWHAYREVESLDYPLWLPLLQLLGSPLAIFSGLQQGWIRFDRELVGLTSLEPWEGLRALQIVRHASHTFFSWSEPLVSAGLALLVMAAALLTIHTLLRFHLYWRARPRRKNQLAEMQKQLAQMHELLLDLNRRLSGWESGAVGPTPALATSE